MASKSLLMEKITVVTAVLALFVSIGSYWGSRKSNQTAEQALGYAEKFFILENRPWLRLKLRQYESTKWYHNAFKDGKKVVVEYLIDVENVGKHPAKRVSFSVKSYLGDLEHPFIEELPTVLELAPKDIEPLNIVTQYKGMEDVESLEAAVKREIENKGVIVDIIARYSSDLDSSKEYTSRKQYRIYGKNYTLLSAESS